jgi:predicted GIY-YIG superfamily endonuclease
MKILNNRPVSITVFDIKGKDCIAFNNGCFFEENIRNEDLLYLIQLLKNTIKYNKQVQIEIKEANEIYEKEIYGNAIIKEKKIKKFNGFIYIVKCNRTNCYKIGITSAKNPETRINQLKHTNPYIEKINAFQTNDYLEELFWHTKFQSKRISGEWFNLSESDLKEIQDFYINKIL